MEPKSIAFYTAVAISILAVLSATTFPMVAQAQGTTDEQESQEQPAQEDSNNENNNEDNNQAVTQSDSNNQQQTEGEDGSSATSNGNGAAGSASERLGLQPNSGIASCGQVITQDVTLTSDLNCDSGDGLIVGASGITINLNGYSITGPNGGSGSQEAVNPTGSQEAANPTSADSDDENGGQQGGEEEVNPTSADSDDENGGQQGGEEEAAAAEPEIRPVTTRQTADYDGSSGILVANADNVAIAGLGEISGFSRGVTFLGSSGGALTDIQLANNDIGAVVASSEGTEISRNTITNNGIAVVSDGSNGGVTAFNQIVANVEQGILLLGSSDNVVAANNMYGNGASGIYLDPMSQRNHLDYNTVFGHEAADLNNADGMPTNVNQNSFGDNNNCGTSLPGGLCR
jgi:parallel beta-helix repeat protein